ILAYVEDASKPAPAAAAGAEGAAGQSAGASGDVSNFMFGGLVVVLIIAFLVILVLNRVIRTLDRIILKSRSDIAEGEEGEDEGGESSGKVFVDKLKKLSRNKKLVFFVVLGIVALLSTAGWNVMWNVGVHEGYQPVQPIKFSHQLHAGVNQIDCQYCHSGAATSKNASIPSLNVCMNCHNHVTASEKYNGEISPE